MKTILEDIANDNSIKEYRNIPLSNSVLDDDYLHMIRKPDERDDPYAKLYFGDWEDVTEKDKREERILRKQKEIEALRRQLLKEQAMAAKKKAEDSD